MNKDREGDRIIFRKDGKKATYISAGGTMWECDIKITDGKAIPITPWVKLQEETQQ